MRGNCGGKEGSGPFGPVVVVDVAVCNSDDIAVGPGAIDAAAAVDAGFGAGAGAVAAVAVAVAGAAVLALSVLSPPDDSGCDAVCCISKVIMCAERSDAEYLLGCRFALTSAGSSLRPASLDFQL